MPAAGPTFRRDVQGLRGIAVLLVVLYHAGLPLSGGFIGVDIFFVISGFVIVRSIREELEATGSLDLRRFYSRRARRLLPAFAVTSLATFAGALLLLDSFGEQQQAVRVGTAASLFSANLALLVGGLDYFGPGQEVNPFLHTWSLSLEEQFYFVLPMSLLVLWRLDHRRGRRRRYLMPVMAVAGGLSLVACVVLTAGPGWIPLDPGTARALAFYGMPLRWWEFAAGMFLALTGRRVSVPGPMRLALVAASLLAIAWVTLSYDGRTAFPGLAAVPPVAATAVLIALVPGVPLVNRVLSNRLLTLMGDVSYGWYLLHWPAIVLAPRLAPGFAAAPVVAAFVSFGLALALYRWVEQPVRHRRTLVGRPLVVISLAGICLPVLAGAAVGYVAVSGRGADPPRGRADDALPVARTQGCIIEGVTGMIPWSRADCLFNAGATKRPLLLLGDSHAASFSDAVVAAGQMLDHPVAVWSRGSCPFVGRAAPGYDACRQWQAAAFDLIDELDPEVVLIANRSPAYVWPTVGTSSPLGPIAQATGSPTSDRESALASWEAGLGETVRAITSRGIAVLLVSVVPEFPPGSFTNATLVHPEPEPPSITRSQLDERRGQVLAREQRAVDGLVGVGWLDPAATLCPSACHAARGDVWLYSDNQHINRFGAELLAMPVAQRLTELIGDEP